MEQDYKKAFYWFTKSAENECPDAYFLLGLSYFHSRGVPKDNKMAYMWASLGVDKIEDSETREFCRSFLQDLVQAEMTVEEMHDAQDMAIEWLEQHEADNK